MNKKNVWFISVAILVIGGLIVLDIQKSLRASGGVLQIGFIGPLTGDAAVYGEAEQKTIELAVEQLNAAGGVNGKQIRMIYEDGQCNGQAATNAAQKLVSVDGVQAIIGGFCSGETIPAVKIATAGKVVMISPGSSSPNLTGASPYFFRDCPSDDSQASIYADLAYHKKGWRTVAVIEEQTDYATDLHDVFAKTFESYGGRVITQAFPSGETDFRSFLTTLKTQKPDALFIDTQTPAASMRILDQLKQIDWKPSLIVDDATSQDSPTVQKYAASLEGAITAEFLPDPNNQHYTAFVRAYQSKYGQPPPYQNYMTATYDAVDLLADGIKTVGYNGTALAQWSRTISGWQGSSGSLTIDSNGDRVGGHAPLMIHDGQAKPYSQ